MDSLLSDPWVAAQIERALAPYAGRVSAEELEWMREQLVATLREDEGAAQLLRRAHPRVVEESGEARPPGSPESDDAPGGRRGRAG
jgi:hypothetical protein